ncbi:MAG: FAD-dependent monooxygenase [Paracoccaceae bacterium]|nr:FAD-dependent monooxygenase [Paracoccaceae bacterium]
MSARSLDIGIAGAGVAGLAAAALLARAGHQITVYDQFPAPAPVGSGLMIQPVGLAVLGQLGLAEEMIALASPITRLLGRTEPRGRAVLDVRYPRGYRGLAVQRGALFDLLYRTAVQTGARVVPGTRVSGTEEQGGKIALLTNSGALGPFDLALDCLGPRSALCPVAAADLAFGALWGLVDWPEDGPFDDGHLAQRYRAASVMAGVLPVGRARPRTPRKATFFWSLRMADHAAWLARPLDDWKAEVLELWPDCACLLDRIRDHRDLTFARYAHRTLGRPVSGRLAHLGDSYHATSPQLGQGANMALLDAMALAVAVEQCADVETTLARYAALRRWHVRIYQAASWLFTPAYQSDSRALPIFRDWVMAPLGRIPPVPSILAMLVGGKIGGPLVGMGLEWPAPRDGW